jgi:ADP-heptose:LPS heptosyltransferase
MRMTNLGQEFEDFTDTAAVIENLDLVISIDTSVAHLAGAMGKPVWVMLPYAADWRWFLNRDDSPWYPTMRLFRQEKQGDWKTVLQRITKELHKVAGGVNDHPV